MFFNLLGVFAQWEREEISDRVNASFLTRAKLGKLLNNACPYGYKVVDGRLVIHPDEAPIRRQAYELFLAHRRKHTVARMFNEKGYRTRKKRLWRWAQIRTMLADPSAKGVHYFNRSRRIGPWKHTPKPESEWGQIECEPIVSAELWNQVNQILVEQARRGRSPVACRRRPSAGSPGAGAAGRCTSATTRQNTSAGSATTRYRSPTSRAYSRNR